MTKINSGELDEEDDDTGGASNITEPPEGDEGEEDFSFTQKVWPSDSRHYDPMGHEISDVFQIAVTDNTGNLGQVQVDIGPVEGVLDDIVSVTVEAARLPDTKFTVPRITVEHQLTGGAVVMHATGDGFMFSQVRFSSPPAPAVAPPAPYTPLQLEEDPPF